MSLQILKSGLSIIRAALILELIIQAIGLLSYPLFRSSIYPRTFTYGKPGSQFNVSQQYMTVVIVLVILLVLSLICAILYLIGWRRLKIFNNVRYGIGFTASILFLILAIIAFVGELGYLFTIAVTIKHTAKYTIAKTVFSYPFINSMNVFISQISHTELLLVTLGFVIVALIIGIGIAIIVLFAIAFFRLGSDYKSTITEIGAILHAIPIVNIVGTILLIIGLSKIMKQI